jgi:hypothetical protein
LAPIGWNAIVIVTRPLAGRAGNSATAAPLASAASTVSTTTPATAAAAAAAASAAAPGCLVTGAARTAHLAGVAISSARAAHRSFRHASGMSDAALAVMENCYGESSSLLTRRYTLPYQTRNPRDRCKPHPAEPNFCQFLGLLRGQYPSRTRLTGQHPKAVQYSSASQKPDLLICQHHFHQLAAIVLCFLRPAADAGERHATGPTICEPRLASAGAASGQNVEAGNVWRVSHRVGGHPSGQETAHERPCNQCLGLHGRLLRAGTVRKGVTWFKTDR